MPNLKCPVCGSETTEYSNTTITCENKKCFLYGLGFSTPEWNASRLAEQRIAADARRKALEEAKRVVESEEELDGNPPVSIVKICDSVNGVKTVMRSVVRSTKKSIIAKLNTL